MHFKVDYLVRFQHCDPAGIVFHPRYHEFFNAIVEDWFAQALDWGFGGLNRDRHEGVPVVHTSCDFRRPSRLGEVLTFDLCIRRLGRSSITLGISASHAGELRVQAEMVLAYVRIEEKVTSLPIPEALRRAMEPYLDPGGR